MSAPRLLIIQPDPSDPPGPLGDWLTGAGAELDVRLPPGDQLPESLDGYQGLVVLGGGMDADDDTNYPWLPAVRRLLATAAGTRLPTLAICLGAQMLADATGGRVVLGDRGPEAGGALVSKKDIAWTDPLFADLPLMQDVLQFHRDAVDRLPPGAELLASAPKYPNQAFRLNGCIYGIQFHIETTPEVVLEWARDSPELAEFARAGAFETETLTRLHEDLEHTWQPFAERFVRLVEGKLQAAVDPGRSLPLA
ncbi:type 1 glutamine amidotransferase [Amycolatopsis nigrescens]|uniref:type 1 glutamine amidotransferase n=1 Tax=Amycolatopsis nigrescens TaxID=381445 RepID=UPI0003708E25|nr:type 1 glutamine amidotransferase [Amycolatopsis nigrescens]